MKVYRIENKCGKGPYSISAKTEADKWSKRSDVHHYGKTRLAPWQDPILRRTWDTRKDKKQFIFGFKDKRQLYQWFNHEEIKALKDLGFYIREIEASEILEGLEQVAFKRKSNV